MNSELLYAVYHNIEEKATTNTEQALLAYLAYMCKAGTNTCYPSRKTISRMTHMGLTTVDAAKDSLRDNGYLSWEAGNINNVPNVYSLHIPQTAKTQGGTPPDGRGVAREAVTKYNIKYSDDAQDTKQGVANDATASVTDTTAAPVEDSGFAAFWAEYPPKYGKTDVREARCRDLYLQSREECAKTPDAAAAFDETVLRALREWRESKDWTRQNGKYIPFPENFLIKKRWLSTPVTEERRKKALTEQKIKEYEALKKDPHLWDNCKKQCTKFQNGKCDIGMDISPDKCEWQMAPKECPYFEAKDTPS